MTAVDNKQETDGLTRDDKLTLFFSGVLLAFIFGYLGGLV